MSELRMDTRTNYIRLIGKNKSGDDYNVLVLDTRSLCKSECNCILSKIMDNIPKYRLRKTHPKEEFVEDISLKKDDESKPFKSSVGIRYQAYWDLASLGEMEKFEIYRGKGVDAMSSRCMLKMMICDYI